MATATSSPPSRPSPLLTPPQPVIALLGDNPQTVEFGSIYNDPGATATDAVDDNDELTTQIAAASTVDTGTVGDYTVTYTVSDKATNAATPVIRMVTVTDTAAPDITAPAAYTTEATATLTPLDRTHYGTATSTDDTADITDDAPRCFPAGRHHYHWTATDKSTNEMMDTQVVTVVDTTKPDIAAPENITKEATAPTTPVTVGLATATDLVTDPVIITRSPEAMSLQSAPTPSPGKQTMATATSSPPSRPSPLPTPPSRSSPCSATIPKPLNSAVLTLTPVPPRPMQWMMTTN